jgi:hypothetical protein
MLTPWLAVPPERPASSGEAQVILKTTKCAPMVYAEAGRRLSWLHSRQTTNLLRAAAPE